MRNFIIPAILVLLLIVQKPGEVSAQQAAGKARVQHVEMTYVSADNYRNRLVNAKAAFAQLQIFLGQATWKPGNSYSFLKDVLNGGFTARNGYVMTQKGFAYGACGASSLLNRLVQTALFKDRDGSEKHVFQTRVVWTWNGDKTYGPYGATIYLDTTGKRKTKDYIWRVNPAYHGTMPTISLNYDDSTHTAGLTMIYSDNA